MANPVSKPASWSGHHWKHEKAWMCSVMGDNLAAAIKVSCSIRHQPWCLNSITNSCWRCSTPSTSTPIGNWNSTTKAGRRVVTLHAGHGWVQRQGGFLQQKNARSNRHHPHTSPNTAPATQNECHDWSCSHMKRHFQYAEQQESPSNFTKYCAYHAKCMSWLILNVIYNARSNRHHPHNLTKHCACHAKWMSWLIRITYATSFTMRRATVNTFQPHQILRLPRKMHVMIEPHHRWNVIYNARSNSQHLPTSPNTAPATQNAMSWLSHITDETSFTMRGATGNTLQPHQILRLPRKMTTQHLTEICWKQVKRHFQCATDPSMIRDRSENDPRTIRPRKRKPQPAAPQRLLFRARQEQILLKITTFPAPAIIPNFTTCCTCHEKWHMNFTKCCACHKKWHMNFTKCCTCHEKWHMNFTKCCACHKKWHMNFTKCCTCHEKWNMNFTTTTTTRTTTRTTTTRTTTTRTTTTRTTTTTTTRTTTTRTTTARTTTATTTTARTTTARTTTATTTTARTTTARTTTATTTTARTTTARTTTATTTTAGTTIPVRLPKSSYIGSLPLNFLW